MSDDWVYAVDEHGRLEVPMRKVPRDATPARTDDERDAIMDSAYAAGREHGLAAASWYFDGNTTRETYRATLAGIREGDPAVYDTFPAGPLSGEWADDPTPTSVLRDLGLSDDDDDADDALAMYEDGFAVAVASLIEGTCIAMLSDDDDDDSERG